MKKTIAILVLLLTVLSVNVLKAQWLTDTTRGATKDTLNVGSSNDTSYVYLNSYNGYTPNKNYITWKQGTVAGIFFLNLQYFPKSESFRTIYVASDSSIMVESKTLFGWYHVPIIPSDSINNQTRLFLPVKSGTFIEAHKVEFIK